MTNAFWCNSNLTKQSSNEVDQIRRQMKEMELRHKKESNAKAEFYESLQMKLQEREDVRFYMN
jgi:hypothetical protein